MTNMFSGNQEKKIPKNLKECYATDNVTHNLWTWCERLEKWGKILFWILIIGGLILSIFSSIVEKEVIVREASYYRDAEIEIRKTFDFEIFIFSLLDTALYAFLEYCAYHIIALLVGSLATIVQHTKITANVALYKAAIEEDFTEETEEIEEQPTVDSKETKPNYSDVLPEINADMVSNVWECSNCGVSNSQNSIHCQVCGKHK